MVFLFMVQSWFCHAKVFYVGALNHPSWCYYTTFYNHIAMFLTPLRDPGKTMVEPHFILQETQGSVELCDGERTEKETEKSLVCARERMHTFHSCCHDLIKERINRNRRKTT